MRYCSECKKQNKRSVFEDSELTQSEKIFSNGTRHIEGKCPNCGRFLAFVSQGIPPYFYFGKHNGELIEDVFKNDPGYLEWVLKQEWLKPKLKKQIEDAQNIKL